MENIENNEKKKTFLKRIMEVGKIIAGKSKDDKINKDIKKRANY